MDALQTIIATTGATILSSSVVLALTKFIERRHARDFENYKSQIQAESERSKLQLENELQMKLFQFQTKFSSLHEKQAEVIGEIHGKLEEAHEYVSHLIHPVQYGDDLKETEKITIEKYQELAEFYTKNKLYLDTETSNKVGAVLKTMKISLTKWGFAQSRPDAMGSLESWNQAWQSVNNEVPPILKELEEQFRQRLDP